MKRYFWVIDLIVLVIIIVLHGWTKRLMADGSVVSNLFATGPHTPATTLVAAISFVTLRFFVIVVLPVSMITRWGMLIAGYFMGLRSDHEKSGDEPTQPSPRPVVQPTAEPAQTSPRFFG